MHCFRIFSRLSGPSVKICTVLCGIFALLVPSAVAAAQPPPAQPGYTAAACALTETSKTVTLDSGRSQGRTYLLRVPSGLTRAAPLLIGLHGGQSNPNAYETQSGWTSFARDNKFIVAYPKGGKKDAPEPNSSWLYDNGNRTDVNFLLDVISDIEGQFCVDTKRVYMTGHSNGGQMTSRMACADSAQLAAVAMYAGGSHGGCEDGVPIRKLSFGFFTADRDFTQPTVFAAHLQWRGTIGCGNDAATETGFEVAEGFRYSCQQGANVVWRKYRDGGHDLPSGDRGKDLRNRIWQLFRNHPLP